MMNRNVHYTKKFRNDVKMCVKRSYDLKLLYTMMKRMESGKMPGIENRDHYLTGKYTGCRECHLSPDWLLIYRISNDLLIFIRTGTHSDLFR